MIQRARQLVLAAHQGIEMNLNIHILELRQGGIGQGIEGLAGRVRDQVNMKFFLHKLSRSLHGDSEAQPSIPSVRARTGVPQGTSVHDKRMTRIAFRDSLARVALP